MRRPPVTRGLLIAALACAAPAVVSAQQPQTAVPLAPLTYNAALDLATSRNLGLEAARRQRAIRVAAIRTARQIPNPDFTFDVTRDLPHEAWSVGMPVEIGGKRSRRVDLAKEELTLAEVDVRTELRIVRKELRQAFYSLIAADLGVARAEADLDVARGTRATAQANLNAVLNLPPQQAVAVAGALADRTAAPGYDSALALAIASNVDLTKLDREIAVEQRRTDLLRAERVPTPVFSVSGFFNNPGGESNTGLGVGVNVGVPIFSRNQGEIAQSIATTAQLRAQRDAARRDVENNVFGTVARIEAQRRQVEAFQQRLVPTATDLESLAEESYRAGRTSILAVFDAQRSLRDLRREALQVMLDLQFSLADLEEILGTALP